MRTYIGLQVEAVADKYGLFQTQIREIISAYIGYCKELLALGQRVDFYGLVSLVPRDSYCSSVPTLRYQAGVVAKEIGLPEYTVYRVLQAYIDDMIRSVKSGVVAEIRGLVSCNPILSAETGNVITVHARISQALSGMNVRASTYKVLRKELARG